MYAIYAIHCCGVLILYIVYINLYYIGSTLFWCSVLYIIHCGGVYFILFIIDIILGFMLFWCFHPCGGVFVLHIFHPIYGGGVFILCTLSYFINDTLWYHWWSVF